MWFYTDRDCVKGGSYKQQHERHGSLGGLIDMINRDKEKCIMIRGYSWFFHEPRDNCLVLGAR